MAGVRVMYAQEASTSLSLQRLLHVPHPTLCDYCTHLESTSVGFEGRYHLTTFASSSRLDVSELVSIIHTRLCMAQDMRLGRSELGEAEPATAFYEIVARGINFLYTAEVL